MVQIQLLLPLQDNGGTRFRAAFYTEVCNELLARLGGLIVYAQAPAAGLWEESGGETRRREQLVIVEVRADQLDRNWWHESQRDAGTAVCAGHAGGACP